MRRRTCVVPRKRGPRMVFLGGNGLAIVRCPDHAGVRQEGGKKGTDEELSKQ